MARRLAVSLALTLVLLAADLPAVSAQAQADGSTLDFTLEHGGLTRTYTLTVPDSLDPAQPAPLLIALHPFASSGKALRALTGLDTLAARDGFLVAYPDSADLYWDDGRPRPSWHPTPQPIDDTGFLDALIDDVSARYAVDPARVVLTGLGGGGTLAYTAACQMPDRFAAVAVVGATIWDYHLRACPEQSAPVPLLILLGAQDAATAPNDPEAITLETAQARVPAAEDEAKRIDLVGTLVFWLERFACDLTAPDDQLSAGILHYDACATGGSVTLVALPGVGANWARAGDYALNQTANDASALVTAFLLDGADATALAAQIAPGMEMWGGKPRSYVVYAPRRYAPAAPLPVIVALHGRGGTGSGMAYLSRFNELAEREGIILVYPDGLNHEWNYLGGTPGYSAQTGADDAGFLTRLVDDLARDFAIDRQRVYLTGFSNGGFMTQRLACDAPDIFAAFGSVGATLSPSFIPHCEGAPPVPILLMHGTHDQVVLWSGMTAGNILIAASMPDTAIFWADHNRCDPEQVVREQIPKADPGAPTEVIRYDIGGCEGRGSVLYEVINGGGHNLPGVVGRLDRSVAGEINTDIDTGEELWAFFAAHPLTE